MSRAQESSLIIEGLLTTTDSNGRPHVAPMGPVVNEELTHWTLRPFASSTTFQLLRAHPICVFHVVDDVLPVVQAALGFPVDLAYQAGPQQTWQIKSACHWYQLEVLEWNLADQRTEATAKVVNHEVQRAFWGWNRAKHAVLEATILATRLHLVERTRIAEDLAKLKTTIDKTAGAREQEAWQLVMNYVEQFDPSGSSQ